MPTTTSRTEQLVQDVEMEMEDDSSEYVGEGNTDHGHQVINSWLNVV